MKLATWLDTNYPTWRTANVDTLLAQINTPVAAERQTTQPRGTPLEREYAGMPKTVRIEWGNGGPGGEYSERDAERLLEVLRQQGLILS